MNIDLVMTEIADQLRTIPKLRVSDHPVDTVNPPHALVSLPEINFDETYGRGTDRYTLPVILAIGKVTNRAARANLAPFVAGSGASSFKQVLEAGDYESFDDVRVPGVTFDVITFAAVDHICATFLLDIYGDGAA